MDLKAANMFLEVVGFDFLKELSPSTQEFFHKNISFIQKDNQKESNTIKNNNSEYFYPADFDEKNIVFVDSVDKFNEMFVHIYC